MKKSLLAKLATVYLRLRFKNRYKGSREVALKEFERQRAAGKKAYKPPSVKPGCSVQKKNIDGMDVYFLGSEGTTKKTILYIHGGGFVNEALGFHWRFVKKLIKRTGAKVIFPIYPLAPFYTYRDMYPKILQLYDEHIATSDDEIIFMGDSSGGGFVLSLYEYLAVNNLRTPDKVISISPWVDLASDNSEMKELDSVDPFLVQSIIRLWGELWAGNDLNNYMASPLQFDKFESLKNITLFIGTDEILYPDALKFFDKIKDNPGCELIVGQRMNHVYPLYPIREARAALDHIVNIIMG